MCDLPTPKFEICTSSTRSDLFLEQITNLQYHNVIVLSSVKTSYACCTNAGCFYWDWTSLVKEIGEAFQETMWFQEHLHKLLAMPKNTLLDWTPWIETGGEPVFMTLQVLTTMFLPTNSQSQANQVVQTHQLAPRLVHPWNIGPTNRVWRQVWVCMGPQWAMWLPPARDICHRQLELRWWCLMATIHLMLRRWHTLWPHHQQCINKTKSYLVIVARMWQWGPIDESFFAKTNWECERFIRTKK